MRGEELWGGALYAGTVSRHEREASVGAEARGDKKRALDELQDAVF